MPSLLRYHGIPTGFCYQRLRLGAVPGKYCIHALNGVYLTPPGDWIRQDARGRRPNREAEFSNVKEILPCHPDPTKEEVDYPFLLPHPHPAVVDCLRRNTDAIWMYLNDLPEELSFPFPARR